MCIKHKNSNPDETVNKNTVTGFTVTIMYNIQYYTATIHK